MEKLLCSLRHIKNVFVSPSECLEFIHIKMNAFFVEEGDAEKILINIVKNIDNIVKADTKWDDITVVIISNES